MREYVVDGVTVFGLIVTLGAWLNGKITRRIVVEHFRRIEQYFEESDRRFEELLRKLEERMRSLIVDLRR